MGKKLALLSLTLHDLLLFAISYWVTHSTSSRTFYRTPRTLLTSSFPNQYTAQTCKVSDITITCLTQCLPRILQGVSGTEPGLSPEGVFLEVTEFVSLIVICHVGAQTKGAETISPRVSIEVEEDSWAPCSVWGYN